MAKNKKIGFLQRWMFIIDKINSYPYINKEELIAAIENEFSTYDGAESVGIKSRTIERDIYEIRNSSYMDISIEYCRERNGYYIPRNEKSLSKLDRLFELSSLLSFSSLKDIVFCENRKSRGLEHRFSLISAIRNEVEISVEYRKYTPSSPKEVRRLRPYALKEFKNRWYLLAMDANACGAAADNLKTWGLDRIERLTLTNRKFKRNTHINLNYEFEHCFGIYRNNDLKPERVVLSFSPLSGKYTDSCPLHESQRTLVHDENEFRVELMIKITPDFITELLSQSRGLRVIEPASLRESLIEIHRQAIQMLVQ
ncbi:YafY family protein [Bacteroides sp. 51]|uniref:helix-turn-helix transcriptional regulator n=1 Tax=Bacteroides sp. 51 TaxID=2302938 RepID=UPI0013D4BC68|nr:WYL domain-containing protein [Bacteroides sp. 51]NDV83202.1 WYL domain-containing protein [Bacteroides sp. 51]